MELNLGMCSAVNLKNIGDDAHGRHGGIDVRIPHHEFLQDVILNGSHQRIQFHSLLLGCDNVESQNGQHRAIHRHAH